MCFRAHLNLYFPFRSALTNDPFTLARFAGFYKAIQSAVSPSAISQPFGTDLTNGGI